MRLYLLRRRNYMYVATKKKGGAVFNDSFLNSGSGLSPIDETQKNGLEKSQQLPTVPLVKRGGGNSIVRVFWISCGVCSSSCL